MSDDKKGALKRWLESGEVFLAPLTFPQRELWEASAIAPGDESNHICTFLKVRGPLTSKECLDSVQRVVDRQESLRLSIIPGKDQPLQMIRSTGTPAMEFRDLPPSLAPEALQEMIEAVFLKKFDMLKGPLYRVEILRHGPNEITMVVALHHAIADGWTLGVFVQDLCQAYLFSLIGADCGLQPVNQSYTAWGAAERAFWTRTELDHRGEYWKKRLAGAPRLWADASLTPARLKRHRLMISAELAQPIRAMAKRHGATLFSTLLTGFQIALSRWSGKTDFVVGTPIANRARTEVRSTMGYCSGNVPMRGQVDASRTFSESLITVQQETVDAFANAMPFAELVRSIGEPKVPGRHPVYQARFALQNHPVPDVDLPELAIHSEMVSTGTARFDLGCEVTEIGDALEVVWLNRESVVPAAEVPELHKLFQDILEEACRCDGSRVGAMV